MNPSTQLATGVLRALVDSGVADVVISPGSRSTPLALVFAAAERRREIRLHVRIDERSAAFLALGIAKASGRAVPVVCTSGTAVANLAPAIVEAAHSGIPLIALTADRPERLRSVGANQTIDQVGFFGQQVLASVDVHADGSRGDDLAQAQVVTRAIHEAVVGGGPVQINLAFDEPLVPTDVGSEDSGFMADPPVPVERIREPIDYALSDIGLAELPSRGVVIVGDVPNRHIAQQAIALAEACGWPLISEPSGNAQSASTAIPHASLFVGGGFLDDHEPDLVVTIGRFGLSRPVLQVVRRAHHHVSVSLAGRDRADPLSTSELNLAAVPREPSAPIPESGSQDWLSSWQAAAARVTVGVSDILSDGGLTGASVAKEVWNASDSKDQIFVASSRTVRYFEAICEPRQDPPWLLGNRGASGIDGLVSTAWGSALINDMSSPDSRTIAVMGDLAFLHDHNGLVVPADEKRPNLTFVVVDNNGGGIFSSLEQGAEAFAQDFDRVFGTPHDLDLVKVASACGVTATRVATCAQLREELARPRSGVAVIVVETTREAENDEWEQLSALQTR